MTVVSNALAWPTPVTALITTVPLFATMSTSVSPPSTTAPAAVSIVTAVAELLVVSTLPSVMFSFAFRSIVPLPARSPLRSP